MLDYGLNGKNVFVTGAAQGIGKATALTFAAYGCNVAIADIKKEGLLKTAEEIKAMGRDALVLEMDVSRSEQVDGCVAAAAAHFGNIHILANCAGITHSCLLKDLPESEWERVININAKSVFLLTKAIANHMIGNGVKGKIISISSQASKLGELGNGVYCCSKTVVNMLTQVFALELAQYGINVNAVCPGYIDTEIMQRVFRERGPIEGMTPKQYEEKLLERVPLRRMAEPEEIGEFIAFLASEKSSYITGVSLTIAGGSTLI